jgi:hypothetical protein
LRPRLISLTFLDAVGVAVGAVALHELQVVHDEQVQAALRLQPAGLGPQFHGADAGRVVYEDGRVRKLLQRRGDPGEVQLLQEAGAESLRVDRGHAGQQAQDELLLAHFQAEDADGLALPDGGVLRDVEREARLTDAGAGGQYHKVARLEAGGQLIQVRETGRDAEDLAAVGMQEVQPVVGVVEERLEGAEAVRAAVLADREQLRLGPVYGLLDIRAVFVADRGDLAGGADEAAKDGLALHDAAVLGHVDGGGSVVAESGKVSGAAHRLQIVVAFQGLGDGDDVYRLAMLEELEHGAEDAAVGLAVEILGVQEVRHFDDGVAVDQDGAQHGLLGVHVLWR